MLLERVNTVPPYLCRLAARNETGRKLLSLSEIAEASGLSRSYVATISLKLSWNGITMDVADKFATACGVDLGHPAPTLRWLRRNGMQHLKRGDPNQRRAIKRVMVSAKRHD